MATWTCCPVDSLYGIIFTAPELSAGGPCFTNWWLQLYGLKCKQTHPYRASPQTVHTPKQVAYTQYTIKSCTKCSPPYIRGNGAQAVHVYGAPCIHKHRVWTLCSWLQCLAVNTVQGGVWYTQWGEACDTGTECVQLHVQCHCCAQCLTVQRAPVVWMRIAA